MVYALRDDQNRGFQKSSIQKAIKEFRIYKGYRWNFVKENKDPNIVNIKPTVEYNSKPSIIDTILQVNNDKTKIINSFYTKDYTAKHLQITKLKMKKIVQNCELYNDYYYIEYYKCPQKLLDDYKIPINRIIPSHSKQIKQIHPVTKQEITFNSLQEIYIKLGFASKTIIQAIESNSVCNGSLWQYA